MDEIAHTPLEAGSAYSGGVARRSVPSTQLQRGVHIEVEVVAGSRACHLARRAVLRHVVYKAHLQHSTIVHRQSYRLECVRHCVQCNVQQTNYIFNTKL